MPGSTVRPYANNLNLSLYPVFRYEATLFGPRRTGESRLPAQTRRREISRGSIPRQPTRKDRNPMSLGVHALDVGHARPRYAQRRQDAAESGQTTDDVRPPLMTRFLFSQRFPRHLLTCFSAKPKRLQSRNGSASDFWLLRSTINRALRHVPAAPSLMHIHPRPTRHHRSGRLHRAPCLNCGPKHRG